MGTVWHLRTGKMLLFIVMTVLIHETISAPRSGSGLIGSGVSVGSLRSRLSGISASGTIAISSLLSKPTRPLRRGQTTRRKTIPHAQEDHPELQRQSPRLQQLWPVLVRGDWSCTA